MTPKQTVLSLGIAFVLGCVAAPVANQIAIRPAQAAPPGVGRWQQYCAYQELLNASKHEHFVEFAKDLSEDMKQRGLEGWELASTSPIARFHGGTEGFIYCFRRPIL